MSKRWSSIQLRCIGYGIYSHWPATVPPWSRTICSSAGPVAKTVPILLLYSGTWRVADRMRQRLRQWGYQDIRMQKEKKARVPPTSQKR